MRQRPNAKKQPATQAVPPFAQLGYGREEREGPTSPPMAMSGGKMYLGAAGSNFVTTRSILVTITTKKTKLSATNSGVTTNRIKGSGGIRGRTSRERERLPRTTPLRTLATTERERIPTAPESRVPELKPRGLSRPSSASSPHIPPPLRVRRQTRGERSRSFRRPRLYRRTGSDSDQATGTC
jgi:hypothetical protein